MKKLIAATLGLALLASPPLARAAGNLAAPPATRLELGITTAAGVLSQNSFELETGKYYRLTITSDGLAELLFRAPAFFENVWINQAVIAGIEIKLFGHGFAGVEFDAAGDVQITFVPVRPGEYPFYFDGNPEIPGGMFIVR